MLKLKELVDQISGDDKDMHLVIKDYDGNLHHLSGGDFIQFSYTENYIILELHDEIEQEE